MTEINYRGIVAVEALQRKAFGNTKDFKGCRYVPGEGGPEAPRVMIIGEAPGAQEAIQGRPFVGPAGRILRDLMELANLRTHDVHEDGPTNPPTGGRNSWLTNVMKFKPPRNRTPTPEEIRLALPSLIVERRALRYPRILICVGKTALTAVMGKPISILDAAGNYFVKNVRSGDGDSKMAVWAMLHPAYVLREMEKQPKLTEQVESDWEKFGDWFARNESRRTGRG